MKKQSKKTTKKTRGDLKQKVIDLFNRTKRDKLRVSEIAHDLHLKKHVTPVLKSILTDLVRERKIDQKKGSYHLRKVKRQLIEGTLQLKDSGFGFVRAEDREQDVFVNAKNIGHAFDKDKVLVELLASKRGDLPEGKIIKVIEHARSQFPGIFHKTKYYSFISPFGKRFNREFIIPPEYQLEAEDGDVVVYSMVEWEENEVNPVGRILRILGRPDDPKIDMEALMVSFGVSEEFSEEVMAEANEKQLVLTSDLLSGRMDLRELTLFTIDPEDAKDFDDAVSLELLDNGNWYLGVHIADVSHFVEENTELDETAFERGTSVYLVDRVIPMLPEFLSNGLCSLKPEEDRLSFSCFMEIDKQGEVVSYELKPSVINSNRRYNYDEVQEILDATKNSDENAEIIKNMWQLAKLLTKNRMDAGTIDFETPEVRFVLDDKGFPIEIIPKYRLDSMRLIEEFMLMANQTVAMHIERISSERILLPFLYRVHETPSNEKIERFIKFLNVLGTNIPAKHLENVKDFQKVINRFHETPEMNLVEEVALRTMMKAQYSTKNIGHYGLGFKFYTHFTSPIRRYPDLWVHRLLKEYEQIVGKNRVEFLKKHLVRMTDRCNKQEINAQQAERESIKMKQVEYITRHIGDELDGSISGVTEFGIFIALRETLIEGLVHIKDLDDDYYVFDEAGMYLMGRHHKKRYRLGDQVRIKVLSASTETRKIDFLIVPENGQPEDNNNE